MSDISKIFEGVDLSESTQKALQAMFESAVEEKVAIAVSEAEEKAKEEVEAKKKELEDEKEEKIEEMVSDLEDKFKDYVTYAVAEWHRKNEKAIISEQKVELADSFLTGFKTMFESHNIEVPQAEDKDIVNEAKEEVEQAKAKLDEALKENLKLKKQINEVQKAKAIADVTESLTAIQKEKVSASLSKIEYIDEAQFNEHAKELISYFVPKIEEEVEKDKATDKINEKVSDPYLNMLLSLRK